MNRLKTIFISWAISLALIAYVALLLVAPWELIPYIVAARVVPFLALWLYDIAKKNCDHGVMSYLLIPQGTLLLVIREFKMDFRTVFKR